MLFILGISSRGLWIESIDISRLSEQIGMITENPLRELLFIWQWRIGDGDKNLK